MGKPSTHAGTQEGRRTETEDVVKTDRGDETQQQTKPQLLRTYLWYKIGCDILVANIRTAFCSFVTNLHSTS